MSDETDLQQAKAEREATSEARAETGPLTGIKDATAGPQPRGTKSDKGPATAAGDIGTGHGTNGGGTAKGNTAAPPNR